MTDKAQPLLNTAADLHDAGVQMYRAKLRREKPDATPEEIATALQRWFRTRPGAVHGDTVGRHCPDHRLLALPDLRAEAQLLAEASTTATSADFGATECGNDLFADVAFVSIGTAPTRIILWDPFLRSIMNAIAYGPGVARPGGFVEEQHTQSAFLFAAFEVLDPAAFLEELSLVDEIRLASGAYGSKLPEVLRALREFVATTLASHARLFYVD